MSNICLFSLHHSASRVSHSTPVCPCIYSCTGDYWWTSSHYLIRNTHFPPAFALFCFCLSICRAQDSEIISILTQALQCTFHTGIKSLVGYYIFKFYLIVCVCVEINDKEVIFLFLRKILITFYFVYFVCMHAYYSMQVEVRGRLDFRESVLSFHQVGFWDWVWSRPCSTLPVPAYPSFWTRKLFIIFF